MPNCKTVVPYRGTPEQEQELRQVILAHADQPGGVMETALCTVAVKLAGNGMQVNFHEVAAWRV